MELTEKQGSVKKDSNGKEQKGGRGKKGEKGCRGKVMEGFASKGGEIMEGEWRKRKE